MSTEHYWYIKILHTTNLYNFHIFSHIEKLTLCVYLKSSAVIKLQKKKLYTYHTRGENRAPGIV